MKDDRTCKETKEKNNSKSEKMKVVLFVLAPAMIILLPLIFFAALNWAANSGAIPIGVAGFIQTAVIHGCFGLLAVMIALISMIKLAKSQKSLKQIIGRTVIFVACAASAFFLVRPLILDLP